VALPAICFDDAYRGKNILSAFRNAFEIYNKSQANFQWRLKQEEKNDDVCVRKGAAEIQKKIKIVALLYTKKVRWWAGECWQNTSLEISVEMNPKAWNVGRVYWRIDVSFANQSLFDWFLRSQMYEALIRNFICDLSENGE